MAWATGSFRDPAGRVWLDGGHVLRVLNERGARDWQAFEVASVKDPVLRTMIVDAVRLPDMRRTAEDVQALAPAVILEQPKIGFISYPFERTFTALKEAALLHLDLMAGLLRNGLELKDATPYNIQYFNGRWSLMDLSSIAVRGRKGGWQAYGQFCTSMLYPLMLAAWRRLPLASALADRNGLPPEVAWGLLGTGSLLRRGVFRHVYAPSKLQDHLPRGEVGATMLRMPEEATQRLVENLRQTIMPLRLARTSTWSQYSLSCSYDQAADARKQALIDQWTKAELTGKRVLDLGANTGTYSRIAARYAEFVIAVESDEASADAIKVSDAGGAIIPLVMSVAALTGAGGWMQQEIEPLAQRARADGVFALALVHHLCVVERLPLQDVVGQLFRLAPVVVVEWVDPADAMFRRLVRRMGGMPSGYDIEALMRAIAVHGDIVAQENLTPTRRLLLCRRR